MKKLIVCLGAVALGFMAHADFAWSWWIGDKNADRSIEGCQLGIGSECQSMKGAQISLIRGVAQDVTGVQGSLFYSKVAKLQKGAQFGFVSVADNAMLQFGLLCWNKNGFLPFFVLFNMDKRFVGEN